MNALSLLSSTNIAGAAGVLGAVLLLVIVASTLTSLVTFVVVVIANRADPDASGKRPAVAYLFGGAFLTLWITVLGVLTVVFTIINLLGSHQYTGTAGELHPYSDMVIRNVVIGLMIALVAGYAHRIHRARGIAITESDSEPSSPSRRVQRGYVAAVSLLSVVGVILATLSALDSVVKIIAPGVFEAMGSRADSVLSLLDALAVIVVSLVIFRSHQSLLPGEQRLFADLVGPRPTTSTDVTE